MVEYLIEFLESLPGGTAFSAVIVVLLLCGVGLPLPEEFPLLAAGYLVYRGGISFPTATIGSMLAILGGDSIIFFIGRKFGIRIFDIPFFQKLLTEERMKKVNHYFHRFGTRVVFVGRFMAGVRATVFVSAGILQMKYRRFILFDSMAALLSVPLLIYIAYRFGEEIELGLTTIRQAGWTIFLLVAFIVVGAAIISRRIKHRRKAVLEAKEEEKAPITP